MTVVRSCAAIRASGNSDKPCDRSEGFTSVIEDWHTKQALLQVWLATVYYVFIKVHKFYARYYGFNTTITRLQLRHQLYVVYITY